MACPRCHPSMTQQPPQTATGRALAQADAAGEEAKRILTAGRAAPYSPYRNPTDQSVYLRPIA